MRLTKSAKLKSKFRIQKIESIEDYYVSTDENYASFNDLEGVIKFLTIEIDNLESEDYEYMVDAFEDIFGPKPINTDELNQYYSSSTVCIGFYVLDTDEVIISVQYDLDLKNNLLDFNNVSIYIHNDYDNIFSKFANEIKKKNN